MPTTTTTTKSSNQIHHRHHQRQAFAAACARLLVVGGVLDLTMAVAVISGTCYLVPGAWYLVCTEYARSLPVLKENPPVPGK